MLLDKLNESLQIIFNEKVDLQRANELCDEIEQIYKNYNKIGTVYAKKDFPHKTFNNNRDRFLMRLSRLNMLRIIFWKRKNIFI